jgi:predicted nucleic acid-binding protein
VTIKSYFDTSVLLKLYNEENGSQAAYARVSHFKILPLTFLGEIELRNSLRVLASRVRILTEELDKMLGCIDEDIARGRLFRLRSDPSIFEQCALELPSKFTITCLCRSLDILPVAHACAAGIRIFTTCDKRQSVLAENAGLKVDVIDLSRIA